MKKLMFAFALVTVVVSCTPQEIDNDTRNETIEKDEIKDGDI
jgi:hypothetical protein